MRSQTLLPNFISKQSKCKQSLAEISITKNSFLQNLFEWNVYWYNFAVKTDPTADQTKLKTWKELTSTKVQEAAKKDKTDDLEKKLQWCSQS